VHGTKPHYAALFTFFGVVLNLISEERIRLTPDFWRLLRQSLG